MPSYTQIAHLPYPAMSDPPNGPDQIQQLARAVEPLLLNRYTSAADRSGKLSAPEEGMVTYRNDDNVFEYYDGKNWAALTQTATFATRAHTASETDRKFSGTESPALTKCNATITNPSPIQRMMWLAIFDWHANYDWDKPDQYARIRQYVQIGKDTPDNRATSQITVSNDMINTSGAFPARSGYLEPKESLTITTWITIEKTNQAAPGVVTLTFSETEMTLIGVTSV